MKLFGWEENEPAEFHMENGIGEALHGEWIEDEEGKDEIFQITRQYADYNTEELRELIEGMTRGRRYPQIWIEEPTIG